MRWLKTLFLMVALSVFAIPAFASLPYDNVVFFGDSLSDNGNLYNADMHVLPKSPPYYQGRFSDGLVWADVLSNTLQSKYHMTTVNEAMGGEPVLRNGVPFALEDSVNSYLLKHLLEDKSHSLFIVWIGANDYLLGSSTPDQFTLEVTNKIQDNIEKLIDAGAKYFLLLNLPDLGLTPRSIEDKTQDALRSLTQLHNSKLSDMANRIHQRHPAVQLELYDVFSLMHDLEDHLDQYNKKFHTHVSNVSGACWTGGYTAKNNNVSLLENDLMKGIGFRDNLDVTGFAKQIAASPTLSEAYRVGKMEDQGGTSCADPASYLFWDHVHPSSVVHLILAQEVQLYLDEKFGA